MQSKVVYAFGIALIVATGSPGGAHASGSSAGEPPAQMEKISLETSLTTIKLTERAEQRLGIAVAPVTLAEVSRQRVYGGTIVPRPENAASIVAPITGTVVSVGTGAAQPLTAGSRVSAGQEVLRFLPLNASDSSPLGALERSQLAVSHVTLVRARIDADARIQNAGVELAAAKTALDRAEQLLRDKVGSQRAVDEVRAVYDLAEKALAAAKRERIALDKKTESGLDNSTPVPLAAPIAGVVQRINVATGQVVISGQVLAEIINPQTLWVRVPVTPSEFDVIAEERGAIVSPLGKQNENQTVKATLVTGLPTADAATSTIDVYFEIDDAPFRSGQRVKVTTFTTESGARLTVPASAVVYDIHGGAWVYVRTEDRTYRRTRVDVLYATDGIAVLAQGPKEGTSVVMDGAAELFGAEFGNDK